MKIPVENDVSALNLQLSNEGSTIYVCSIAWRQSCFCFLILGFLLEQLSKTKMKTYIYNTSKRRVSWLNMFAIFSMISMLFFVSCEDEESEPTTEPVAAFTTSINELEVTFTNSSTDATIFAWSFGDGTTSTEKSPVHTYDDNGTYTVTLVATDASGKMDTAEESITVSKTAVPPTADFSFTVADLEVTFTNTSTDATSYSWDFGDGNSSTEEAPTHTYAQAGTFTVTLTATGEHNLTDEESKEVTVTAPVVPEASFTSSATNLEVTFTNTSINATSYSWDFGDGNTSTEEAPTHTYAAAGTYTVTLTASDDNNSDEATEEITVTAPASNSTNLVLNGSFDEYTAKTSDNADAWDMTPNSTIVNNDDAEVESPYKPLWNNTDLNTYIDETYCTDEQPNTTSDGSYQNGEKTRGAKFSSSCRRLYQVVEVVAGQSYTFSIDTRAEAEGINTEVFILNTEITTEEGINANKEDAAIDAYQEITSESHFNSSKGDADTNTFHKTTITFTASTNKVVIYVRALNSMDSDTEVFLDNVSLIAE